MTDPADPAWGQLLIYVMIRAALPDAAVLASLGCGNPTAVAELRPGEVVLDLGSGGGIDVLLPSASRVGPIGYAYGLDMTDEMLELARNNAAEAGATNVEFPQGPDRTDPARRRLGRRRHQQLRHQSFDQQGRGPRRGRASAPARSRGRHRATSSRTTACRPKSGPSAAASSAASPAPCRSRSTGLGSRPSALANTSVTATHSVGGGLHGAIVKATKPAAWTMADIRPVDLPKPSNAGLQVLAKVAAAACGYGCGCS